MKQNIRKTNQKTWFGIAALTLLMIAAAALLTYRIVHHRHVIAAAKTAQSDSATYSKPLQSNDTPNKTNPNGTPTQVEENSAVDTASGSDITGVINFASVVGSNVTIRATINQSLSDGTCTLKLTRGSDGKSVTRTASIVTNPSSTTCAGFDIPTDELGSGNWAISLRVSSGQKAGTITGNVQI
jgi:hypothetical protein